MLMYNKMLPRNPSMEADTAKTARHIMGTGIVMLGIMFVATGLEFPSHVAQKARENVCITSPTSAHYPQWLVDFNTTKRNSVVIWNLTNPVDVFEKAALPQWNLIGPYVYMEVERKLDIQFRNGYIEYLSWVTQTWDEHATALLCGSNCTLDTEVTVVSPWMVSNSASLPPMTIARALLADYRRADLKENNSWFVRLTVREFLMGHYRTIAETNVTTKLDSKRPPRPTVPPNPTFPEQSSSGGMSVRLVRLGTHPMDFKTAFSESAAGSGRAIKEWIPGVLRHSETETEAMIYGLQAKLSTCLVDRSLDSNLYWQEVKWSPDRSWSILKGHGLLIPPGPEPRSCVNAQSSKQVVTIAWPTLFQDIEMKAVKQQRDGGNPPTWLYEVSEMRNETWIDPINRYHCQLESDLPPISAEQNLRAIWVPFQVHIEPLSGLIWQRSISFRGFAQLPNNTLWPQVFVARTEIIDDPYILRQRHYSVTLLLVACGGLAGFSLIGAAIVITGLCVACFRRPQNRITPVVARRQFPLQHRPVTNSASLNN